MRALFWLTVCVSLMLTGCGNLSPFGNLSPKLKPKLRQNIGNDNKIDEIQSDQNSNRVELMNLRSQLEILKSQLDHIQVGMANAQNNGTIQILSGPTGLSIVVLSALILLILACVGVHYHNQAIANQKAADMMAQQVVQGGTNLQEEVFKAAMYTDAEEIVYNLIKKHQDLLNS